MPAWVSALLPLLIKIGSPYLLELFKKWVKSLSPEIQAIINEVINGIIDPKVDTREAKKRALVKLKEHRHAVADVPDTK